MSSRSPFDLNLLVALDVLLDEQSVSLAAQRLGITQSAMSRCLARLRTTFGDELLVRTARGMRPTTRALDLRASLRRLLLDAGALVSAPTFDPLTSKRTFRILTAELNHILTVVPLLEELRRRAPEVNVEVVPLELGIRTFESGQIDLHIGPRAVSGVGLVWQELYRDDFTCLVSADNPVKKLTLKRFLAMPQVLVAPTGRPGSLVDRVLEKRGEARRIVLRTPSFLVVPAVLVGSPYVTTLPRRLADLFCQQHPLRQLEPPIALDPLIMYLSWHEIHRGDPAHTWFRQLALAVNG